MTTDLIIEDLSGGFANPPSEWKTRPLWFWNGPLDKAKTTEIITKSADSGYYGFGILPTEKMETPFMGVDYLDHYLHAVETAARLGLKICLYDEFWFPSGSAGGLLRERYPEALSQRLDLFESEWTGPATATVDRPVGQLMSVVAMNTVSYERLDLRPYLSGEHLIWEVPPGSWKVLFFVCVQDGARDLVDYLNPEAVKRFIELTYEKYYETFPGHFGTTIDCAFYDEPTFHWVEGGRAWTPSFNRRFEDRYGQDPTLLYPALWYDIGADTAAIRNQLFGFRAELFSTAFVKTIADWCEAHGIELTGHMDQEEIVNPVGLCGDLIKSFEHQPIPGLDQVFAYGRGSKIYKVVSSAALNYGRRLVMTECYGGIDLPLANLYREAMDQFTKGVNMMVPHAVWYQPDDIIFRPELSYRTEPYASELPAYNDYMGRLQSVLQQGCPVADIAILYPIAGLQAAYQFGVGVPYEGGVIPEWADYMEVGECLSLELRQDFTYLHPETLESRCWVEGNQIRLNDSDLYQHFQVLILPGSTTISLAALLKAEAFYDSGGKVIATTRLPDKATESDKHDVVRSIIRKLFPLGDAHNSKEWANRNEQGGMAWFISEPDVDSLGSALKEVLSAPDVNWVTRSHVEGGNLGYIHKKIGDREFYFFANSSDTAVSTSVSLRGRLRMECWNPHTGEINEYRSSIEDDRTHLDLELPPVSSVFFVGATTEKS